MNPCTYSLATPFIINTDIESVDKYIDTLSKYGKRYMRRAQRDHGNCKFTEAPFSAALYGQSRPAREQLGIDNIQPSSVECMLKYIHRRDQYRMFVVSDHIGDRGYIFLKSCGDFAVASCPIPTSDVNNTTYFNYYIWYNIIRICVESDICWLNLGESKSWISEHKGHQQPTWRNFLSTRDKNLHEWDGVKNSSFFLLVPKSVKDNPQQEKNYIIVQCKKCTDRSEEILHDIDTSNMCICSACNFTHVLSDKHVVK